MNIKTKECKNCKKPFTTDSDRRHYCSEECRTTAQRNRKRLRYKLNIKKKYSDEALNTPIRCENSKCGKLFVRKTGNQLYCCDACRNQAKRDEWRSYKSGINEKEKRKKKTKYSIDDIALIEKYFRVVHKVVKHYGIIAYEVENGKEYNLNEIRAAIRAQEAQR